MEYAAPYAVSSTDRTGLIVIVETLLMSWMIIVSLIRLYMRITINGPVQMDDLMIFVGSDEASSSSLKRAGEPGCSLQFSQLASAAILNTSWISWPSKSIAGILCVSYDPTFPSFTDISIQDTAWKAITAFDVFTDVLSFGLCIFLVWGIQMRLKEKFTVIFAFGTRLPLIILIILRQTYLNNALHHPDPSLTLSNAVISTAVLLHSSIMIATVPCLKPFVISFNTGWGQGVNGSSGNSYFTPTGQSSNQSRAYASRTEEDEVDLTVRQSEESHHSQQLIIRHTQEWKLEEEYEMHSVKDQVQI
ncbi:hypothetical protein N7540_009175 [Penicillium herquei]|nr:hypothetical protein N7540_009175 [Penicillium herquei]